MKRILLNCDMGESFGAGCMGDDVPFADRAYLAGAVHHEPQRILDQALAIAQGEAFADIDGKPLRLQADSLCVHGDNAESLAVLRRLRAQLDALS